jgi:23S rRNA (cytosine1962-C5)-methyltransferase
MKLILKKEKAPHILRSRHPWIFQGAVKDISGTVEHGALADIVDEQGGPIGRGFYSAVSKIACRVLFWEGEEPSPDWVLQRLREALTVRESLRIESNAFRLINAEGDFFPGLVLDVYGRLAVIRPQIRGVEKLVPEITTALAEIFPGYAVYLKRDERAARVERLELAGGYLSGTDEGPLVIEENDIKFWVDVKEGQKTGFYLDQRENRALVRQAASGRRVLNLFSYTGAFALQALRGGARAADSVDSSQAAVQTAEKNFQLNDFSRAGEAHWIREDAFDFLDRAGRYDLIVLDPPPFARTRGEVPGALRGYRRLQAKALRRIDPGGLLFTFSCSGGVDTASFRRVLMEGAWETGRQVRVIRELRAAPDHPWSLLHPEGEYLKGFMAYVS